MLDAALCLYKSQHADAFRRKALSLPFANHLSHTGQSNVQNDKAHTCNKTKMLPSVYFPTYLLLGLTVPKSS